MKFNSILFVYHFFNNTQYFQAENNDVNVKSTYIQLHLTD